MSAAPPPIRVRLRDLSIKDPARRAAVHAIVERFLDHGIFIQGHELAAFEEAFAGFCERPFAVGVSSASSGLYLALRALGIGPGHEVITTPMTWLMTASAITLVGATPVFVDVDERFNLDPSLVEAAITPRTRALLPVHFYGRVCDMPPLMAIARKHGLRVIEDVAQAAGATLGGTRAGAFGDVGVFSFNPMKVLGAMGDAGALVFADPGLLEPLRMLRLVGTVRGETCLAPELKHTMDPLQAAIVRDLLPRAAAILERRNLLAGRYRAQLRSPVVCPDPGPPGLHTFYDFTVRVPERAALMAHLAAQGIEVKVRHPILVCDQPIYAELPRAAVPRARAMLSEILCLPMHANLSEADVDVVCESVHAFYG